MQMSRFLNSLKASPAHFVRDETGAQVVEYALIIAVVSIALVILLGSATAGFDFTTFVGRVSTCLSTANCF
jgi:pilus assembly protein Flp/PilA